MKRRIHKLDIRSSLWTAQHAQAIRFIFACLLTAGLLRIPGDAAQAGQLESLEPFPPRGNVTLTQPMSVALTPVTSRIFEGNLSVEGILKAVNVTMASPSLTGVIKEIYVNEGDLVEAHKTKLFRMDTRELEKTIDLLRRDCELASRELKIKITHLNFLDKEQEKAYRILQKLRRLIERGLISREEFQQAESQYLQAQSAFNLANELTALAAERKNNINEALEFNKKTLSNAIVYAPISGRITRRFLWPGERCDPGQPVLSIEDPSVIDVIASLPVRYYTLIHAGKTKLSLEACGVNIWDQVISFKNFLTDPSARTFTIKSRLKEVTEDISPGAPAKIIITIPPIKGLGVPSSCIQRRGREESVFVIHGETAHRVLVQTGIECEGWTHLTESGLNKNDFVVSEGHSLLKEGTPIVMQKRGE